MKHVVTIDRRAPLAFDRTTLSIAHEGMRGPRTPFSPERTIVPRIRTLRKKNHYRRIGEAGRDQGSSRTGTHGNAVPVLFRRDAIA